MGMISAVRNLLRVRSGGAAPAPSSHRSTRASYSLEIPWPHLAGRGGNLPSDNLHLPGESRPAEEIVPAYAALMARCESIRQVPLRVVTGDDQLVESGPLVELLERPNPWQDTVAYLDMIEACRTLYNVAYVLVIGDGPRPEALLPVPPSHLTIEWGWWEPTGSRIPIRYHYLDPQAGRMSSWDPEQVICIQGANPHALFEPLSPLSAGRRTLKQEVAQREHNLGLFSNGGVPDLALETDQDLTEEQAGEFMARWRDNYHGVANAHVPALMTNGIKAKAIGLSPEELQSFEALRFTAQECFMLFRVWPAMLGVMVGETGLSQGSSTNEQKVAWWNQVGLGELAQIVGAHQRALVDGFSWRGTSRSARHSEAFGIRSARAAMTRARVARAASSFELLPDLNAIPELVEHREAKVTTAKELLTMGWRPDDVNDYLALGLPPHPSNVGRIPLSMVEVGTSSESGVRSPESKGRETDPMDRMASVGRSLDKLDELVTGMEARDSDVRGPVSGVHGQALRKAFDRVLKVHSKRHARRWSKYYMEQRKRVLSRLEEARVSLPEGARESRDFSGLEIRESAGDWDLGELFPRGEEDELLAVRFGPLWQESLEAGWEFFREFDLGDSEAVSPFAVDDPRTAHALEQRRIQGAKVNDTTEDDLRGILRTSIEAGESTAELGDRIADYYKQHVGETSARPQTAARTQVAGIVNDGRMLAAQDAGGLYKAWLHGAPDEPRQAHIDAESRYAKDPIPLDQLFEVGLARMMSPGAAEAPISETANCTCMVVFVPAPTNQPEGE